MQSFISKENDYSELRSLFVTPDEAFRFLLSSRKLVFIAGEDSHDVPACVFDFAENFGFELIILCHTEHLAKWQDQIAGAHAPQCETSVFAIRASPSQTLESLLCLGAGEVQRIGFANHPSLLTAQLAGRCGAVVFHAAAEGAGTVCDKPVCTLITSLFRSDDFLTGFLSNAASIEGYAESVEHVILLSSTTPYERQMLVRHLTAYVNCLIVWNRADPGLYECWNLGIRLARSEYVSNANVDDLRHPKQVARLTQCLDNDADVSVAASALVPFYHYTSDLASIDSSKAWYVDQAGKFEYKDLARLSTRDDGSLSLDSHNLPHCMPVWRKNLHDRFGFFDETKFGTFADWAFWLDVTRAGCKGLLHPEPLSYYFVNPVSHNRRGDLLEHYHRAVESVHLEGFSSQSKCRTRNACTALDGKVPRKLHLHGMDAVYGQHRNSFNKIVQSLEPLHCGPGGVRFIPFLERQFVWGEDEGEAMSTDPRPLREPWIGILHCPFDAPSWFHPELSPESFFKSALWHESLPACRGIICLSTDLQADLRQWLPSIPSIAMLHPTAFDAKKFSFDEYRKRPRLVQIGDWLRKLQAIHQIRPCGHEKWMLTKFHTKDYLEREISIFGDFRTDDVKVLDFISNGDYDEMMSSSVVLCLLYATAANNVVLECIARATPIIINPLPSVVEYLGPDYPLYASSTDEAELLLCSPDLIREASEYLACKVDHSQFTYDAFRNQLANSSFYADI